MKPKRPTRGGETKARRSGAATPAKRRAAKATSSGKSATPAGAKSGASAAKRAARPQAGGAEAKVAKTKAKLQTKPKAKPKAAAPAPAKSRRSDSSFRLSRDAVPESYHIHLLPDLNRAIFRGEELIELDLTRSRSTIELHAVEIEIDRAEITPRPQRSARPGAPVSRTPSYGPPDTSKRQETVAIVPRPARESVELKFPRSIGPGRFVLSIAFHGELKKRLRGLYLAQSGNRRYAFTQLEAADARRAFPCFDEPDFKARFTFSVTARSGMTVISNNPLRRADHNVNGTTTSHFTPTPPMSTYLCALAIGELESLEQRHLGTVPVRVWHVPGKAHLTGFALETAIASLQRLERYFGIPYPYEKLDLVAVPDFEAGAMENAGAVFFRETLLLVDPDTATLAEKKRVAEVIAHELAHMWFGNLVTMRWWDDLWLNEAFATWMAFRVVAEWKPEWRMWNSFEPHRATALAMDGLTNTHPIYSPVENAAQATENFDAITYEKGASVVRMLESYLGPENFRAGVRAYIRRHRESNAVASDLWEALESASGQPVEKIVKAWIQQPGFPIVRLTREAHDGHNELAIRQERFRASPITKVPSTPSTWPVPLVVKVPGRGAHGARVVRALVQKARDKVDLGAGKPPAWYYGNADEGGFYRVHQDEESLAALAQDLPGRLAPVERMGLLGHQWAIVRAGRADLTSFLSLVAALCGEEDYEVLDALSGPLAFVDDQLTDTAGPKCRQALQAWMIDLFSAGWQRLGWDPEPNETEEQALRRASLLRLVGVLGEEQSVAHEAAERLDDYLEEPRSLEPNLADSFVSIVARDGDLERFARMRAAVETAQTPQERRRLQLALGDFRQPKAIEQALALTLLPEVPTQDVSFLLIRLLSNRVARPQAWAFIQKSWEPLSRRLPPMMASRLIEATSALQTTEYRKQVNAFFHRHPVETAKRALRLALERFDVNEEFRRRAAPQLRAWLIRE